jgi:hypothetical protein
MSDPEKKRQETEEKRLYRRPRIVFREPLEVIAAVCPDFDQKGDILSCDRVSS